MVLRFSLALSGDFAALARSIERAKKKFALQDEVRIVSCYEAGRDGFWLHRCLQSKGFENVVLDSSSIEVNRRARRAKTDRLDVDKLLSMLLRHLDGERKVFSIVRVPSVQDEDDRRLHRELDRLKKERTAHRNRIRSLLVAQGLGNAFGKDLAKQLDHLRLWDGSPLPAELKAEIHRELKRLELLAEQVHELEAKHLEQVTHGDTAKLRQIQHLQMLCSIGEVSSRVFVMELFGWRKFKNRKEVAAALGLTPTPYNSGQSERDQGISKSGNRRVRALAIEIAWLWLRYQPHSKLSRWFDERFAGGGKRMRRIGIVAVARKLMIDLWKYLEYGVIPEGAKLKKAA